MRKTIGAQLWRTLEVLQVYGANTEVGKTIVTTAILQAFCRRGGQGEGSYDAAYIKPVSTGPPEQDDSAHVSAHCPRVSVDTLFRYRIPVSPHLAATFRDRSLVTGQAGPGHGFRTGRVGDDELLLKTAEALEAVAAEPNCHTAIVETAGGVLSPAPSGNLQADVYRPLRLPVVLVGDSRLGGISSTISAYESLRLRGYDVVGVFTMLHPYLDNDHFLNSYFASRPVPVVTIPAPPKSEIDSELDHYQMTKYYDSLKDHKSFSNWQLSMPRRLRRRRERLDSLSQRAHQSIWHPFMQHTERSPKTILAIDSAHGDFFQTVADGPSMLRSSFDGSASWWTQGLGHGNPDLALEAAYAAGRYGHVMFANAAHEPAVTLAQDLLKPDATRMSNLLSSAIKTPRWLKQHERRLSKVFYSDNGSTAMEVAVKMALRAASLRRHWSPASDNIKILGLKNSYHGDTIGVMNCSEPNVYNEKVEWYQDDKGVWLSFPTVRMKAGKWHVIPPDVQHEGEFVSRTFDTLDQLWDLEARQDDLAHYIKLLKNLLTHVTEVEGHKIGALMIEPIILGAGGMLFVDPVFQTALVQAARSMYNEEKMRKSEDAASTSGEASTDTLDKTSCSSSSSTNDTQLSDDWTGVPVITDEVFTGMYRLGHRWASEMIGVVPDIRVTAKLLTGGLIPLAATIATDPIYNAFLSDNKADALLHGHSYTAHAVGCQVALFSLNRYKSLQAVDWEAFRHQWRENSAAEDSEVTRQNLDMIRTKHTSDSKEDHDIADMSEHSPDSEASAMHNTAFWSAWSKDFIIQLSFRDDVEGVFALGFVLAIEVKDPSGAGYSSTASHSIRDRLIQGSRGPESSIHCRVLGNVLYFMASLTSKPKVLKEIEASIWQALDNPSEVD